MTIIGTAMLLGLMLLGTAARILDAHEREATMVVAASEVWVSRDALLDEFHELELFTPEELGVWHAEALVEDVSWERASLERRRVKVRGIRASILKSFEEDIRARGKATPDEYREARVYIESVIDKKWPIP